MDKATDFISLSEKYDDKNKKQELICLYQAAFYAQKHKDTFLLNSINNKISEICAEGYDVPGTSIVILSFNTLDYTKQCLESVKETVPLDRCQIVVVDNASSDGSLEYLRTLDWITLVENKENRGFPGGCNDGINVSFPENDIYLLNSDTILPKNALFWLKMGLYENDSVGSCGSLSNYAAGGQAVNRNWESKEDMISFAQKTNVAMEHPYEYRMFLIGFSLLIKRSVLNETGLLDERFNPGNSEDIDICLRILKNGHVNLLCRNSFVIHFGSKSFSVLQKQGQNYGSLLEKNSKKLGEKLGFNPWEAFRCVKRAAFNQIKADHKKPFQVLELGSGIGSTAALIKTAFQNAVYTGIEAESRMAAYAGAFGDIITGSYLDIDPGDYFGKAQFDVIIYSEADDKEIVKKYSPYLKKDGQLINEKSRPLLSISMLCNGAHKEETKKCLAALMTIKNRISSELVIVDTGCDEEMKNLISSYADKVVPFKWCDDFAKARNAGLKECHGEWFMSVDDDEWFENTDELVDFFISGKYKNYKQAAYIVRNYLDMDSRNYDDFWVGRMTKMMPETHYIGLIHEYLTPLIGDCAMIHSYEHHYGYVYKDMREHMAKARRNIKPLIRMIKEDPTNLHWCSQLVQEYMACRLDSNLYSFCGQVLEKIDKIDDPEINRVRADFYCGRLVASNGLYDYDGTIKDFNIFRKDRRNNEICMANLYFLVVIAYFQQKDFSHVINYGHKYLDIYEKWKDYDDLSERLNSVGSLTTKYIFGKKKIITLVGLVISAGIEEKETDDLFRYFDILSDLYSDGSQYEFTWGETINAISEFEYDDRFVEIADKLLSYDKVMVEVTARAKEIENANEDEEKIKKLIRVFGQTKNGRNYYLDYMRFMYEAEFGNDSTKLSEKFKTLILMTNDFLNHDKKLWETAERKSIDIAEVFKKTPFKKWYRVVNEYFDRHDEKQTEPVRRLMSHLSSDEDQRFVFYRLKLKETEVIQYKGEKNALELLTDYCRDCILFYSTIYTKEQFEEDSSLSLLPSQGIFAARFLEALGDKSSSKKEKKIEKCIGIYEPFDSVIREYLKTEEESKKKIAFIFYQSSEWKSIEPLWNVVDKETDFISIVLPIPYYEKNTDGTLGEYHFERENLPDEINGSYFADVDLAELNPDVIFIFDQMDGGNPTAAVPAQYYATELQKYTKMLIFVPKEVLAKEGMAEKIFTQVKEQLKK